MLVDLVELHRVNSWHLYKRKSFCSAAFCQTCFHMPCLACEFLGKVSDNKLTQKVPKEILSRPKTVNESSNQFDFQCVLCYIISINGYFIPSPFVAK